MFDARMAAAVERLASIYQPMCDAELGRPWVWGDYAEEGTRFAGFVAYGYLRELSAQIAVQRSNEGRPPTLAQRLLAQTHAGYRDIGALLCGIDAGTADLAPAPGEWSLRAVLSHITEAHAGFYVMLITNIERHRQGAWNGQPVGAAAYDRLLGPEAAVRQILDGPYEGILAYFDATHARLLADLADLSDEETLHPARYWESQVFPIRFRLQRIDAHIRQHGIQIEQTLAAIGRPAGEGTLLVRLLYSALADVEGALIGAPATAADAVSDVADMIEGLAEGISG